jgi:hypothetical protein
LGAEVLILQPLRCGHRVNIVEFFDQLVCSFLRLNLLYQLQGPVTLDEAYFGNVVLALLEDCAAVFDLSGELSFKQIFHFLANLLWDPLIRDRLHQVNI